MIDVTREIDALLTLRHPTRPGCKLPLALRKLLPDPLRSYEEWMRFKCEDIAEMTPSARKAEAFRLRIGIASVDDDSIPDFILARLTRLEADAV